MQKLVIPTEQTLFIPMEQTLFILIPTYNERGNIEKLILKIEKVLKTIGAWDFFILVVDDSSPDGTAEIVKEIVRKDKMVLLLLRKEKTGLGAAYFAGMKEAFGKFRADVVIQMDADLSHDPSYIPEFIKKIEEGNNFIIGSRYIEGGSIAQGWALHRKFLSVFGNKLTSILLGGCLTDWTSGYRAIKREVFEKVSPQITDFKGYTFNISFAHYALLGGAKVSQVPIRFFDRTQGKSKLGFEYLWHTPLFLFKQSLVLAKARAKTRLSLLFQSIFKK